MKLYIFTQEMQLNYTKIFTSSNVKCYIICVTITSYTAMTLYASQFSMAFNCASLLLKFHLTLKLMCEFEINL